MILPLCLASFAVLLWLCAATTQDEGAANVTLPTNSTPLEVKEPCALIDSVNITGKFEGAATQNQSFEYEGVQIPLHLVGVYNATIENGVRRPAEPHLRACICKVRPCLRFCCPAGRFYDVKNRTCATFPGLNITEQSVEIRLANGSDYSVNTSMHFSVHVGPPCQRMRFIAKDSHIVHWTIHENGTIAHHTHHFSRLNCLSPYQLHHPTWEWQPLACAPEKFPHVLGVREWTYAMCLIIAVICMAIILFIYLLCNDLRNTFYGVAIKAYTLSTIIGYSLLAHLTLTDPSEMTRFACSNIPCFVVLYLVLSFYILCFISFNFYLNFHGVILTKLMFWLIFFPIVLLAVGWSFFVGYDHYANKAVFGADICWFDPRNWSIMVYFYAPIFVACLICGFFYLVTLIRISEFTEAESNKVSTGIERNRFESFWKFFAYTFAAWVIFMSSFAINYYRNEQSHINYAVCIFVALHGFGALYTLVGKNQQIQNFLRKMEDGDGDDDDEICESSVPMSNF